MAQIIWTEPALADLEDIAEYIALDNTSAAKRLVQRVFKHIEQLEAHPESGRIPEELPDSRYREIVVGPCRIFYRCEQATVLIVYVMRSERQLRNYILHERSQGQA